MPAKRLRPTPPARMVELLAETKIRLLSEGRTLRVGDFERAWDAAWDVMVRERAWPHNTTLRQDWRKAMDEAMKPEARDAFLERPTGFHFYAVAVLGQVDERDGDDLTMLDVTVAYAVA